MMNNRTEGSLTSEGLWQMLSVVELFQTLPPRRLGVGTTFSEEDLLHSNRSEEKILVITDVCASSDGSLVAVAMQRPGRTDHIKGAN